MPKTVLHADNPLIASWSGSCNPPRCKPDPRFPNGVDLDVSRGATATCQIKLQCPAKGQGGWLVQCAACGSNAFATTAGRPDDPRSIKIPCKAPGPSVPRH
jgi:hypothetical protein